MPVGKCYGCGRQTNSCTSDWWEHQGKPTECYGAFVAGKWVKGCAYNETSDFNRQFVDSLVKRTRR